ncbi:MULTISPECIES: hypothetical protein [unclassified Streptomyces]|uniref:hypothetical protein n=1 Tax=unclassified Streptomyces TaxID=2593676 RepID=UPI002E2FFDCE|nr:hypothetical protein [Streptomyces sp. NBC_01268]
MNTGRRERRFHPPDVPARPEGISPETARLLESAVRQALSDAVRTLGDGTSGATPTSAAAPDGARDAAAPPRPPGEGTSGDGYEVPSYADAGRPVTVPLRDGPGVPATGPVGRPAGGLGPAEVTGSGTRDLGGGARPWDAPAPPARPGEWAPERLATLRTRMGDGFEHAPLGRISLDDLTVGSTEVALVPALGDTGPGRTVADRLGPGAFYLDPVARERLGPAATPVPGAGYAVHRVTADGHRHDTGLRVVTQDTGTVPSGILACTGDLGPVREHTGAVRPRVPEGADGAGLFSGVLWGADEHLDQVVECVRVLAEAVRPEGPGRDRHWFWDATADCVEHPLVVASRGPRELRELYVDKLDQGEFFLAGRVLCQLVLMLLSLPGRLADPGPLTLRRVGPADLGALGLRAADVIRFLFAGPHAVLTAEGALLGLGGGADVLVAGPWDKGTSALCRSGLATALEEGDLPLVPGETEELARALGLPPGPGPHEDRVRRETARRLRERHERHDPPGPDAPPVTPS